jgi:peptide/nickel transport system substrate-binding protein
MQSIDEKGPLVMSDIPNVLTPSGLKRRSLLGGAAAFGLAVPFAGALGRARAADATPVKGGHLKIGMSGGQSSDSLDPALLTNYAPTLFNYCWGETLINVGLDGTPQPNLAESWTSSKDAKIWTLKIRKGVTFHNGQTMTADDCVKTLQRHMDPKTKSGALGVLGGIASVATDGDAMVITLSGANADLPLLVTDYHLVVQPGGGIDKPTAGIGTGPYKVGNVQPGVRYSGTKYAGYWNSDLGHVESVDVIVMNDDTARTAALQSGQVHIINQVDPKIVSFMKRNPRVVIETVAGRGQNIFNMFCDTGPFKSNDVRMALKLAMDREQLTKQIMLGYASIGNDFPINKAYPLFPSDIPQRTCDPDKAKFFYKKSGNTDPIVLRSAEVAFSGAVDAATLFQQQAQKAGIPVQVVREPDDGYWSNVWNKKPFSASYWGGRATQDQMYSTAYLSKADWNDTHFFHPEFDTMLLQARGELDTAKRAEMYHDMGMLVRDQGGSLLPFFNDFIDARSSTVMGWVSDPNGPLSNYQAPLRVWLKA